MDGITGSVAHLWHIRTENTLNRRQPSATYAQVSGYLGTADTGRFQAFNPLVVGSSPTGPTAFNVLRRLMGDVRPSADV
jgi:hypothetical protein